MLQQCTIKAPNGALGLNLSRAPWDPYPWVSGVQAKSNAELGGVCIGDTLLQLNGRDVLGMRISELATRLREHWLSGADQVTLMMWRQEPNPALSGDDPIEAAHAVQHGINQQSLQKFATCLQHIAQLLECPVCCDVIKPPSWQCCNGHVLCNNCRNRSVKCPVCRVPLGPRGRCLLSDNLFTLLAENFPCDGVKANNSNNNKSGNKKCTTEYHNQPKMALTKSNTIKKSRKTSRQMHSAVISVVNDAEGVEVAAEAAVIECVKQVGGRPQGNEQTVQILKNNVNDAAAAVTAATQQQQQQPQQHNNNMLVKPKLKLSKKSWQITGRGDQDELHSDEVANINNGQQQAREGGQVLKPSKGQQQYQNYHCPTGKSCNSSSSNSSNSQAKLCNKLSTVKQEPNTTESAVYEKLTLLLLPSAFSEIAFPSLSASNHKEDHDKRQPSIKKTLQHFHGTFNQRLHVHVQLGAEPLPASLRLNEAHTFFLAALAIAGVRGDEKDTYAVFLWHLNEQEEEQESQQFQTIIESECSRVKWFGSAQPHTRSWQEISAAGEYLTWSNSIKHNNNCTTFDIIIKKKAPLV